MRRLLLVAALGLACGPALGETTPLTERGRLNQAMVGGMRCHKVSDFLDGDSIAFPTGGGTIARIRARIRGSDTPEMNGKCPEERAKAQEARSELVRLSQPCVLILTDMEADRFGRILVWVFTRDGREIVPMMIAKGLGNPYDGTGPRKPWCPAGG